MLSPFVTAVCPSPHGWPHQWPHMVRLRPSSSHGHRFLPWTFSCPDTLASQCFLPIPLVFLAVRKEMDLGLFYFAQPWRIWFVLWIYSDPRLPQMCLAHLSSISSYAWRLTPLPGISSHVFWGLMFCDSEAKLLVALRPAPPGASSS